MQTRMNPTTSIPITNTAKMMASPMLNLSSIAVMSVVEFLDVRSALVCPDVRFTVDVVQQWNHAGSGSSVDKCGVVVDILADRE